MSRKRTSRALELSRPCPTPDKDQHHSEEAAQEKADECSARRGVKLRVYRCEPDGCLWWHLTSKTEGGIF